MGQRRIRYQVAASLDGFLGGPNGEHDWIPMDPDIDFSALFSQFDTILCGRHTYAALAAQGRGTMPGMRTIVFSTTLQQSDHPDVTVISGEASRAIAELRAGPGKDIWLFGGGVLFRSLAGAGLVDTVEVAVVPVLLGSGVALVPPGDRISLTLTGHKVYGKSGIAVLEYAIRACGRGGL
ncbi:MAG: dihydrofolate reductase family protein [Bryobacteraceae bacterium]